MTLEEALETYRLSSGEDSGVLAAWECRQNRRYSSWALETMLETYGWGVEMTFET